jgi:hypothetical protein
MSFSVYSLAWLLVLPGLWSYPNHRAACCSFVRGLMLFSADHWFRRRPQRQRKQGAASCASPEIRPASPNRDMHYGIREAPKNLEDVYGDPGLVSTARRQTCRHRAKLVALPKK